MEALRKEIHSYWSYRAEGYSEYNRQELADERKENWRRVLLEQIEQEMPGRTPGEIRVLDIGTGPGFFARILAEEEFCVSAIDASEEMLKLAKINAGRYAKQIHWVQGDVQQLPFEDASFDLIVSRNVTWNLPHPERAYAEWYRVLDHNGVMLNFDANWYGYLFDDEKKRAFEQDRENTRKKRLSDCNVGDRFDVCEEIARKVPLSSVSRPKWDREALKTAGFSEIRVNEKIWETVWSETEKINCASTPMFLVSGRKDERKKRIVSYWSKRSSSFKEQRRAELHDPIAERWMTEIREHIPRDRKLRILDVGCGTGYFSILLAKEGHEVTGIDLTPDMIEKGRLLAEEEGAVCSLQVGDAEHPDFPDEYFDVVISRNLTWTLPHTDQAYAQWLRILKAGGVLINFDADYGLEDSEDVSKLPPKHAHHMLGYDMLHENNAIKRLLPVSYYIRPYWDLKILGELGVETFYLDLGVSKRLYAEKNNGFYNPTPLFLLVAEKPE